MDASTIIEILAAVASGSVAIAAFWNASRANRAQAAATVAQVKGASAVVEAGAYERAQRIYEGAIKRLQDQGDEMSQQVRTLGDEVEQLRTSNMELRQSNMDLKAEVGRLRRSNDQLTAELARFRG